MADMNIAFTCPDATSWNPEEIEEIKPCFDKPKSCEQSLQDGMTHGESERH